MERITFLLKVDRPIYSIMHAQLYDLLNCTKFAFVFTVVCGHVRIDLLELRTKEYHGTNSMGLFCCCCCFVKPYWCVNVWWKFWQNIVKLHKMQWRETPVQYEIFECAFSFRGSEIQSRWLYPDFTALLLTNLINYYLKGAINVKYISIRNIIWIKQAGLESLCNSHC